MENKLVIELLLAILQGVNVLVMQGYDKTKDTNVKRLTEAYLKYVDSTINMSKEEIHSND